jgi:hypothetical protein
MTTMTWKGFTTLEQAGRINLDSLLLSDAAGRLGDEIYTKGIQALMRITTGIMMNQVRSLRTRAIIESLENHSQQD